MKNPAAVALGRLGGKAGKGQSKARPNMRAIGALGGKARWAKRRTKKNEEGNR